MGSKTGQIVRFHLVRQLYLCLTIVYFRSFFLSVESLAVSICRHKQITCMSTMFFFFGHRVFFLRFPPLSIGVKDYGPVEDTGCHCSSVNHDDAHSQNAAVEVPMAPH